MRLQEALQMLRGLPEEVMRLAGPVQSFLEPSLWPVWLHQVCHD